MIATLTLTFTIHPGFAISALHHFIDGPIFAILGILTSAPSFTEEPRDCKTAIARFFAVKVFVTIHNPFFFTV